jgi:hypothetical protein
MAVCSYHSWRKSSLCSGSQHGTEADWVSEFEIVVYYVIWWRVSFEGQR